MLALCTGDVNAGLEGRVRASSG